ncbi:Response regulator receiver modulated metal dependent phosphohydrolase [Rubrivivax sp. A210]|uniref:HD domain-containing phosphohydrolase n=1 Tax=Rubrivivax sp. A210 TaxID=2772301 RepID=UPI00198F981D|nr:HD domain-containing phosphohydrolase [Rubrivivax sp. A210]CAD5374361.1 Response regulator receiver modulated metal dependent phosphohydrolase [Rubrivivax sp. A210]
MGEPIPTTPATLLLVDDEPGILSSLRRLFRPHGWRILTADGGAEGLEILAREPVDLVISDMRMPEMDGARFLETVRERRPEVVRLLLTGYADISSTVAAINRGAIYRYIAKPWDDGEIVLIVQKALEWAGLERENRRLSEQIRRQNEELRELNAGLEDKVAQRTAELAQTNGFLNLANEELKRNFMVSIKMFSSLIEMRQGAVGGHSRRVADLARRLAARLGLDARAQQDVLLAGLLHDIGKIGFPDGLLAQPPSRLSAEEQQRYRKHPVAGQDALMPLAELHQAAAFVRSHHERWDGLGFPDGLEGEAIPLGARIVAVVNEHDDLQTGMAAERQLGSDEALQAMLAARGRRYDPRVFDAFVELLGGGAEAERDCVLLAGELKAGMVLARDLHGPGGTLLLAADYVLDTRLVQQIQQFAQREGALLQLHVRADKRH